MIRKPNGNIVALDNTFGGNLFVDISNIISISSGISATGDITVEILFRETKNFIQTTLDKDNYTKLVNRFMEEVD